MNFKKNRAFTIMLLLLVYNVMAQTDSVKIISTSSSQYKQKPGSSIYPAFVDNMPYQSWTENGSTLYYQLNAEAGQKPYQWSIVSGNLPDGMVMTSDGKLKGTPTKEGKFSFIVKVTDSQGNKAEKSMDFIAEPYRAKWLVDAKFGVWFPWGTPVQPVSYTKEDIAAFEKQITKFNADQWVNFVVNLGGKVLNYSVKGGDGIRMWPSTTPSTHELKTSRNIVKELIVACHKKNIKFVGYFAPDHTWNKKVNDTAPDGTWGTLNKGLIRELIEMGVDGFWVDMGGTPEIYKKEVDPKWFPWDEILPMARTMNPNVIFSNNPGLGNGGTVLRWPDTDVLVYEGFTGDTENALLIAKPSILKKKIAIEVDNLLDSTWNWIPAKKRTPKSADMIIKNIKANWAVGATYMLDIPVSKNGDITSKEYAPILQKIGNFVKLNQNISELPASSLDKNTVYDSTQLLVLVPKKNAKIYYTTDGTTPTVKSNVYLAPIKIIKSTRIKAISIEPGKDPSKVLDENYNIKSAGKNLKTQSKTLISTVNAAIQETADDKEYYRGMKIIVGSEPVILNGIGRKFAAGNKNVHSIIIKRYEDDYPIFTSEINTGKVKLESDGFQYIQIPPLTLNAGQSYVIAVKEDKTDKFFPENFNKQIETPVGIRIADYYILNSHGDRRPITDDQIGSVLNLKYQLAGNKAKTNFALGSDVRLLDNSDQPLLAWMGRYFAENAVDGNLKTRAQAGGQYAWTLQIDLRKRIDKVKQAVIDFNTDAFATDFQLLSSSDGNTWRTVVERHNNSAIHIVLNFLPTQARYFRIRALKPDGPNQKGGGMGLTEVELYQ